jgi:hypothetical protein
MTAETPRPPPGVQGAVEVGEVKKRCSSSPTANKPPEQAPSRKPCGFGAFPKSDRSERRDGYGPYSEVRLAQMDARFSAALARAHPERRRS